MITLKLFGYPSVWRQHEQETGFVSEKALALLIFIAVTQETQSREYLTGLLWGDTDEKKAKASLRSALYNLGKLFPDLLDANRKTVRLAQPVESDIYQLIHQQDPTVYSADFLAGFYIPDAQEFEDWQLRQRERFRSHALEAWTSLAQQAEAAHHPQKAIEAWRGLTKLEPWREDPHRHIMRHLAFQGNYEEALHQFKTCKETLAEELGIEPSQRTVRLADQIEAAREQPRDNLPTQTEPFFGRISEQNDLLTRLKNKRLITITGIGGSGKTRLAQEIGRQVRHRYLNGVCFIGLDGVLPTENNAAVPIVQAMIRALTMADMLPIIETSDPTSWLIEQLAERHMLLILDNFEQLVEAATLLDKLLDETEQISILVTSRERLRLRQEQTLTLGGLDYPTDTNQVALAQSGCGQVFLSTAQRIGSMETIDDEEAVKRICHLVDGLPLAVEMAAGWTDIDSTATIADSLAADLDYLQLDERNRPNRQRSMRAVFDYSWRKLITEEQACLSQLSIMPGAFSAQAAQAIVGANRRLLARLTNKSLLQASGEGEFKLHPLLRQFSAEKLTTNQTTLNQTHFDYYWNWLAQTYPDDGPYQHPKAAFTLINYPHIQKAWGWAVAQGNIDALSDNMGNLARYVNHHHRFADFEAMMQQAEPLFRSASAQQQKLWCDFLYQNAIAHLRNNRPKTGTQQAQTALSILESLDQTDDEVVWLEADITNLLSVLYRSQGNLTDGIEYGLKSISLHETLSDQNKIARPLANTGAALVFVGRYQEGATLLERGLAICHKNQNVDGAIHFENNLGLLYFEQGDFAQAQTYFEAGLKNATLLEREMLEMTLAHNVADAMVEQGQYTEALPLCQQSEIIMERLGEHRVNLELFYTWSSALLALGEPEKAIQKLIQGLTVSLTVDNPPSSLQILCGVGQLLHKQNHAAADGVLSYVSQHAQVNIRSKVSAETLLSKPQQPPQSTLPLAQFIQQTVVILQTL